MFMAWWNIEIRLCCKFTAESVSEKSLKIRLIFDEVMDKSFVSCFFDSQCSFDLQSVSHILNSVYRPIVKYGRLVLPAASLR